MSTYFVVMSEIRLKWPKIKDPLGDSHNIPLSVPIILILTGTIHFIIEGVSLIKLGNIRDFNWGIFSALGLADTILLPLLTLIMVIDMVVALLGVYFLKHIEATDEEHLDKFREKFGHG